MKLTCIIGDAVGGKSSYLSELDSADIFLPREMTMKACLLFLPTFFPLSPKDLPEDDGDVYMRNIKESIHVCIRKQRREREITATAAVIAAYTTQLQTPPPPTSTDGRQP